MTPRDVVAGATGQGDVDETIVELEASSASAAPSCYTGSKFSETVKLKGDTFDAALSSCTSSKSSETVYLNVDSDTGSLELMGSGLDSISCLRLSPVGVTTCTESGDLPSAAPACHTCSKLSKTMNLKVNTLASETGNFDLTDCGLESISCQGKSLVNATTSAGRERPSAIFAHQCRSFLLHEFELSETANLNVDSETGSLELKGSGLESISCLRKSSIGETAYTGSGDPPVPLRPVTHVRN